MSDPKVQVARCPKCEKVVLMSVLPLNKDAIKEFYKLQMKNDCTIDIITLQQARSSDMCFLTCHKEVPNKPISDGSSRDFVAGGFQSLMSRL